MEQTSSGHTSTLPDYPRGVTFEEVWAALKENAERNKEISQMMQETDRQLKESAERHKEIDQMMKENAERQKETDQQMKETDRRWERTKRIIEENGRQIGGLHRSFGELAEHLVAPGIVRRFRGLGFKFDSIADGNFKILDDQGQVITEIDLLLENDEYIIAIEVKARPAAGDIEHHTRRLEILRDHRRKKNDSRKIQGAIAGAIFGKAEKKAALDAGFYVLEQSGDTMKIDIPQGFVPKEW